MKLKQIRGVLDISASSTTPGNGNPVAYTEAETRSGALMPINMNMYDVDFDFIPQYGMKIIAGRAFSNAFATDSTKAFIINETTVKDLGYASAKDAVGKRFIQGGRTGQIVGVIQDFHVESVKENVKPLNLRINPKNIGVFTLTIKVQRYS